MTNTAKGKTTDGALEWSRDEDTTAAVAAWKYEGDGGHPPSQ